MVYQPKRDKNQNDLMILSMINTNDQFYYVVKWLLWLIVVYYITAVYIFKQFESLRVLTETLRKVNIR